MVFSCAQTEFVEEEEHDHCITSRINLVDLAGSERCTSAQTSGDRLRVTVALFILCHDYPQCILLLTLLYMLNSGELDCNTLLNNAIHHEI